MKRRWQEIVFWFGFWGLVRFEPWSAFAYDCLWFWGHRPRWLLRVQHG